MFKQRNHDKIKAVQCGLLGWFTLAMVGGCAGDITAEFQRRCDLIAQGTQPSSGLRMGEVIDPWTVDENAFPDQIRDVLDAWSVEVRALNANEPTRLITAAEYDAILARAASKFGMKAPDCSAWSRYLEKADSWRLRVDNIYPLCEAYDEAIKSSPEASSPSEQHEIAFQKAVRDWKQKAEWSQDAVVVVERLAKMTPAARGLKMASELITYFGAPEMIRPCERMVREVELAGESQQ